MSIPPQGVNTLKVIIFLYSKMLGFARLEDRWSKHLPYGKKETFDELGL